jgi:hypothetical protein
VQQLMLNFLVKLFFRTLKYHFVQKEVLPMEKQLIMHRRMIGLPKDIFLCNTIDPWLPLLPWKGAVFLNIFHTGFTGLCIAHTVHY